MNAPYIFIPELPPLSSSKKVPPEVLLALDIDLLPGKLEFQICGLHIKE